MKVIVAADHGGLTIKDKVAVWLGKTGYEVLDVGATKFDPDDDFPDVVRAAVKTWKQNPEAKMILWCRSGAGVAIAANRYPGVYCGLGISDQQVAAATRDDHLNALALAADFTSPAMQKLMIKTFLHVSASQEARFARRLAKIDQYAREETEQCKSSLQS